MAEAFHAQLMARVQHAFEYLQEFPAAIDHLAHLAYVDSAEQHSSREVACVFANGVRERDPRLQLLLGGKRTLSEALNQALELEVADIAAEALHALTSERRVILGERPQTTSGLDLWGAKSLPG